MAHRLLLMTALAGGLLAAVAPAQTYVPGQAPDWDQPYWYTPGSPNGGPGPDPTPGVVDFWNAWSGPTSGSNLAGHWEDVLGPPVADGVPFPNTSMPFGAGPLWQDYLADASGLRPVGNLPSLPTDVGYGMDTNGLGLLIGNPPHPGTFLKDLDTGLWRFFQTVQPGVWTTGTQGQAYAAGVRTDGITPATPHGSPITAFAEITGEINAGRTLLVSWTHWNVVPLGPQLPPSGGGEAAFTLHFYTFGPMAPDPWGNDETWTGGFGPNSIGHVVTAVGYLSAGDPLNPMPGTDWVIVHDNVIQTPRNIAVPLNFNDWVANTTVAPTGPGVGLHSFSLDDNPAGPIGSPPGVIPGFGAENPFGIPVPGFPPGLAPSPTLGLLPASDADVQSSGPVFQTPSPNGGYIASLSENTIDPFLAIRLDFSVDRLTVAQPGTLVAQQAAFGQAAGDIYRAGPVLPPPAAFAGVLGPGPFAGFLPTPGGPPVQVMAIDEIQPGFLAGGVPVVATIPAPAPATGNTDNVDGFERSVVASPPGQFVNWTYFSVYPDEALAVGVSSADLFDVAPGMGGTITVPFAPSLSMGLDAAGPGTDAIDALVMFDNNAFGGPANGGPGAEPGIDYALFSLAPGSASLALFGLDAGDVLFTDFTGAFAVYAQSVAIGLIPNPGGPVGTDNLDALEVACAADTDFDGDVDLSDLAGLLRNFGAMGIGLQGDLDYDGDVDLSDLAALLASFGCRV